MNKQLLLKKSDRLRPRPFLAPGGDLVGEAAEFAQARALRAALLALGKGLLSVDDSTLDLPLRQLRVCLTLCGGRESMSELSRELGVSLEQIVVTEMRDHTYFAELHLRQAEGNLTVLSSRPSDAIALAVRCAAPLFASEALLDEVGQEPTAEPEEEEAEILDEFRDFIEHVNPDDFA